MSFGPVGEPDPVEARPDGRLERRSRRAPGSGRRSTGSRAARAGDRGRSPAAPIRGRSARGRRRARRPRIREAAAVRLDAARRRLRTSVVLPAPLGPSSPRISPGASSSDTPSSARRSPKLLESSRISRGSAGRPARQAWCGGSSPGALGGCPASRTARTGLISRRHFEGNMSSVDVRPPRRGGKSRHPAVASCRRARARSSPRTASRSRAAAPWRWALLGAVLLLRRRDPVRRRARGRAARRPRSSRSSRSSPCTRCCVFFLACYYALSGRRSIADFLKLSSPRPARDLARRRRDRRRRLGPDDHHGERHPRRLVPGLAEVPGRVRRRRRPSRR